MRIQYILCFLIFSFSALAQQKELTLEDAVLRQGGKLNPKRPAFFSWVPGTNEFSFIEDNTLVISSVKGKDKKISLNTVNKSLKGIDPLPAFPPVKWISKDSLEFNTKGKKVRMARNGGTGISVVSEYPEKSENFDSHQNGNTAYNVGNDLYVRNSKGDQFRLTNDGSETLLYGRSVHRDEFGIHKGTFWSLSGNLLAFYRMDQSMVTEYPIININDRPASAKMIRYPMAGGKSHHVTVGVFNVKNQKIVYLKTEGPKEQYLTNIAWSPDDSLIYIVIVNRAQDQAKLNVYSASNGDFIKTLFAEKHPKYIQPLEPLEFIPAHNNQFIYQSAVSGFNSLYYYSTDGKLIRKLTEDGMEVTRLIGFTRDGNKLFFQAATAENQIGRDIFSCGISDGKITRLTSGQGTHSAIMSETGDFLAVDFTDRKTPARNFIMDQKGKEIRTINISENPFKDYKLGNLKLFSIPASDGTPLYCRLITPPSFDSTKKYPVMIYVYGGPGAQLVTDTWLGGNDLFLYYMAQKGFVVFTLENRGSEGRGKNFEQTTFRQLGKVEMEDQMKGVEYLKTLKYVDASRMGVYGWSFGGFMSTSLMTRHPGTFKAAVAGGPVIDWKYYEVMYTERYMDTPEENPAGYEDSDLLNYVKDLDGKLMLIHGTSDDVVLWQHSLMYLKKAVELGKQVDYFVYPGHLHNVRGKDRVHLLRKISEYFIMHL